MVLPNQSNSESERQDSTSTGNAGGNSDLASNRGESNQSAPPRQNLSEAINRENAARRSRLPQTGSKSSVKGISSAAAMSDALKLDKSWLELQNKPAERIVVESRLLDHKLDEADLSSTKSSRDTVAKARAQSGKNLRAPVQSLFGRILSFVGKHSISFGISAGLAIVCGGLVQLHSWHTANQQVAIGEQLLAAGNVKDSIIAFDKAVALNRSSSNAYLLRGKAYARLGKLESAFENYKLALSSDRANFEAAYQCAELTLNRSQYQSAIRYFQEYLKHLPATPAVSPEVYQQLARAYAGDGQYLQAVEKLNDYLKLNPGDAEAMLLRAECYLKARIPRDAVIDCTRVIKTDDTNPTAYILRALSYQQLNNKQQALADYSRAISVNPSGSLAYVKRGAYYASQANFAAAEQDFLKATKLDPTDFSAYEEKARAYFLEGDLAKAEQEFEALSFRRGFKPDATYLLYRADLYFSSGEYDRALETFKNAQKKDSSRQSLYVLKIADCYAGQKKFGQALDLCNKVVAKEPLNSEAAAKQGHFNYLSGNKISAKASLFKAIQLDPKNADAFLLRGKYYLAEKQLGSAAEDFKMALALDPTCTAASASLNDCHGQATTKIVRHDDLTAAPVVSKAELKSIAEADAKTLQKKGYEELKSGRNEVALLALTRAVQLAPNCSLSRRYLAHAMVSAGDGCGAVKQLYVWEKLEPVDPKDEVNFARILNNAGDADNARVVFAHIITKFPSDAKAMLAVAKACAELKFASESSRAVEIGLKRASETEKLEFNSILSAAKAQEERRVDPAGKT